jgi:hypothetical protein
MSAVSDQPRRFFVGRDYSTVVIVSPLASKADGRHQDRCSICGRPVVPADPLAPRKALRRPPKAKTAATFSTSEVTCTKCSPDFSTSTN